MTWRGWLYAIFFALCLWVLGWYILQGGWAWGAESRISVHPCAPPAQPGCWEVWANPANGIESLDLMVHYVPVHPEFGPAIAAGLGGQCLVAGKGGVGTGKISVACMTALPSNAIGVIARFFVTGATSVVVQSCSINEGACN